MLIIPLACRIAAALRSRHPGAAGAMLILTPLCAAQAPFSKDIHRMFPDVPTRAHLSLLVDMDGDGWRDAVLVRPLVNNGPPRKLEVYRNEGVGRFEGAPLAVLDLPDDVNAVAARDVDSGSGSPKALKKTSPPSSSSVTRSSPSCARLR